MQRVRRQVVTVPLTVADDVGSGDFDADFKETGMRTNDTM